MDCKQEPAARTFCRLTLLAIEGCMVAVLRLVVDIVLIPLHCITMSVREVMRLHGWRWLLLPLAVWIGLVKAFVFPFMLATLTMGDTIEICKAEWRGRWRYAEPKMPDGTPIDLTE